MSYHRTKYLIESIEYIYKLEKKEIWEWNLMRNVYPEVAKIYNKNLNNIKCSISRATDKMFYECKEGKLKEYLKLSDISKIDSKTIIETILNKIL